MAYLDRTARPSTATDSKCTWAPKARPSTSPIFVGSVNPERAELYMCGPIRLMDAVRRAWIERGLSPAHLRFETFGNSGWYEAEAFRVRDPRA